MEQKLVDVKEMASDGSYISAEVSRNSWVNIEVELELFPRPPTQCRTATYK